MQAHKVTGGILLFLGLLVTVWLQAVELETRFNAGNVAYSRGEYDKAIEIYEKIVAEEGSGAGLLYNLANSYARKGQVGLAILNYERALKIHPADADILGNLSKVRKDSGLFTEEPEKVEQFFQVLSIDGWTIGAFACLLLLAILLAARLKYRVLPKSLILAGYSALFLAIVCVSATIYSYQSYNPLVVIADDVKLQVSPFEGATSTGAVEEGRLLFPVKQHGDYTYVADKSGRKGWLQNSVVEAVCR